jgi:hypothetical protein
VFNFLESSQYNFLDFVYNCVSRVPPLVQLSLQTRQSDLTPLCVRADHLHLSHTELLYSWFSAVRNRSGWTHVNLRHLAGSHVRTISRSIYSTNTIRVPIIGITLHSYCSCEVGGRARRIIVTRFTGTAPASGEL